MALTDEGMGTTMLVQPSGGMPYPVYGNGGGFGHGFGGDWAWIILLLLLGWGNGGFGGYGGFGGGNEIYPWMNQAEITSDGFRDQMINNNITSIRDGIGNLSTQLCNCCGDVQMALANGFAGVEQGANARQIANMQQGFALQTAMGQGFNGLQSQFADCCCENRLGLADLKYTVATENCADRAALSDGIRDIIATQTASTQKILDQMCNDKIDAKNEIAELQNRLNMAELRESQIAQNAFIAQGLNNEVDALYDRLSNCPVPSTPVYGRQPIFTCGGNNGCGCNGGF